MDNNENIQISVVSNDNSLTPERYLNRQRTDFEKMFDYLMNSKNEFSVSNNEFDRTIHVGAVSFVFTKEGSLFTED